MTPARSSFLPRQAVHRCAAALVAIALLSCDPAAESVAYEELPLTILQRWDFPKGPFGGAGPAAMDTSGTAIVGFPADAAVLALDADGEVRWRFGRSGEGPGEFASIGSISLVGDSVFVIDPAQQRMVTLSREGELLGTTRLQLPGFGIPYRLAGGDLAFSAYPAAAALTPGYQLPTLRIDMDGVASDTLATVSLQSFQISVSHDSQVSHTGHPLPSDPIVRVAPGGDFVVRVERRASENGTSPSTATIAWIDLQGKVIAEREVHFPPVLLTPSARDSLLEKVRSALPPIPELREAAVDQVNLPDFFPPVSRVLVGSGGEVWLREARIGADTIGWLRVSSAAGTSGWLRLSEPTRLLASGGCRVLIAEPNSLGVESITLGAVCDGAGQASGAAR